MCKYYDVMKFIASMLKCQHHHDSAGLECCEKKIGEPTYTPSPLIVESIFKIPPHEVLLLIHKLKKEEGKTRRGDFIPKNYFMICIQPLSKWDCVVY